MHEGEVAPSIALFNLSEQLYPTRALLPRLLRREMSSFKIDPSLATFESNGGFLVQLFSAAEEILRRQGFSLAACTLLLPFHSAELPALALRYHPNWGNSERACWVLYLQQGKVRSDDTVALRLPQAQKSSLPHLQFCERQPSCRNNVRHTRQSRERMGMEPKSQQRLPYERPLSRPRKLHSRHERAGPASEVDVAL